MASSKYFSVITNFCVKLMVCSMACCAAASLLNTFNKNNVAARHAKLLGCHRFNVTKIIYLSIHPFRLKYYWIP